MDKLKMQTINKTQQNIEKLKELFPNAITEKKDENNNLQYAINFDLLKQELSEDLIADQEFYDFTWVGKKASIIEANKPIRKTLRPVPDESKDWQNTKNLYIEGDNLDVLKLLQESYLNKVKMIYIDPPYNTGKDFLYKDDWKMSKEDYDEKTNLRDDEENRLFQNNDSNGRFHSDWCSMIYPRLKLARNLLSEDGVIFISIDDNEVHNLRKICDEVFGEGNFIGNFIKKSKVGGGSDSKYIATEHEYILSYSKVISILPEMFEDHNKDYLKRYKESDSKGKFFWDTFARPGLKNPINYDIEAPDGSLINGDWIWSKKRFEEAYKNNEIRILKKSNGEWTVHFKQYLNLEGKKPRSMTSNFGNTFEGKKEITSLFNNNRIFSYPKSTMHIKKLYGHKIQLDFVES